MDYRIKIRVETVTTIHWNPITELWKPKSKEKTIYSLRRLRGPKF